MACAAVNDRLPWSLISTAVSSIGSLGLAVFVLRFSSESEYGQFGLAFTFYTLSLTLNRAVAGSPLILLHSGRIPDLQAKGEEAALSKSLAMGGICSVAGIPLLLLLSVNPMTALAVCCSIPFLLIVDTHRYIFFMRERPRGAAMVDVAWTAGQFMGLGLLLLVGIESTWAAVLAWGTSGVLTGTALTVGSPAHPRLNKARHDIRTNAKLIRPLVVEMGALGACDFIVALTVAVSASQAVLGEFRAGALLLAPFSVVLSAMIVSVVPRCVRLRQCERPYQAELNAGFIRLMPVPALLLVATLFAPSKLGEAVLGTDWYQIQDTAWEWAGVMVAMGLSTTAFAKLRIESRLELAMWLRVGFLPVLLCVVWVSTYYGDARGAVLGYGASTLILYASSVLALRVTDRRRADAFA